jgi:uncharacterized Zn finger protein
MKHRGWKPYVPVAQRRANAQGAAEKRAKSGDALSPVSIQGRAIARTFWGKAWCDNLERYSDFANRLPRGRTYVRNGSVFDLRIEPGRVAALVSGSEVYKVEVKVAAVPPRRWQALCRESAGAIDSLVELLQGRLSRGVMERLCRDGTGLFPSPQEIALSCSCPDWASMCKHVAAALYGIGARLDEQPELLFVLRRVEAQELIAHAGQGVQAAANRGPADNRVLRGENLSALFGLEMGGPTQPPRARRGRKQEPAKRAGKQAKGGGAKASTDKAPARTPSRARGKRPPLHT